MFEFKLNSRKRTKIFPKNVYDFVALLLLMICYSAGLLYDIYVLIPYATVHPIIYYINVLFVIYITTNVIGNFIYLILTDTSILTIIDNSSNNQQPGWRFCSICEAHAPPRSFHCHVCKICILKREHHCVFTACCVGFYNYRYFMAFILHLWIAALYSVFLNYVVGYIWQWFSATEFYTLFYHIFPILFWIFGKVGTQLLGVLIMSVMFLHGSLFLTSILLYHLNLIINGQTKSEKRYKVFKYKSKFWKDNIIKVFGPNWLHTLLWFNARSQLEGDGTHFKTSINM